MARHPEVYADHAAEFWLTIGTDPEKALCIACTNLPSAGRREPANLLLVPRRNFFVVHWLCREVVDTIRSF